MPELISPLELGQEDGSPDSHDASQASDLEAVREMVLRAHPDVVPELVAGDSVAALLASVEPTRSAYARLAEAWSDAQPQPVSVPAGGGAPLPIDPEKIPSAEKIRRGLQAANRRTSQEG
ncbi:MAG TPA: hypothetical protein VGR29_12110 [Thermomicrobiales bacterium]|nr:hypothetical protein [Thermomicrobiales bacterium]